MLAIPPELMQRLLNALAGCSALDSDQATRVVFNDVRLYAWRDRVPESTLNHATRVATLIFTLSDEINTQGDNALVVLLYVLADSTSANEALRSELLSLARTFETQLTVDLMNPARLAAPPPDGRYDLFEHIPLPLHYIPRPNILATIRASLLDNPDEPAPTFTVKMNALYGMGGIGKTVIARALCDDPEVQAAFPDGILWVTLGQTPNLTARLREWVETLGGIISEKAPTPDQLKKRLAQLLKGRACLLIVDDVCQRTHAEAFQVGGARCRLLLTTRDAEIPQALGATLQPIDVLSADQAMALVEQWTEGNLDETPLDLKQDIVARLGCLPLALKLAGAQLQDEAPEEWLRAFEIDALEVPRVESLHARLVATFVHSLHQLPPQDRLCYQSLAIFREDETIPVAAITKLWKTQRALSRRKVIQLLKDLASQALLQIIETSDGLYVTLHNLLRDFITTELGTQGVLATHHTLLDAYRATKTSTGWHTAPDDGYLYSHLAYHLDAVGDYNELKGLFADDAWLQARVVADNYTYDGYLADLTLVWKQAVAMSASEQANTPQLAADYLHYALIRTSVNELVNHDEDKWEQVLTALATQMTCHQLMTGLEALRTIKNEEHRARILIALAPQLTSDLLKEGLAAAHTIKHETKRARVLGALGRQLTGDLVKEGLAEARTIMDERNRARVLAILAPRLTDDLLAEGLAATQAIADEWGQVWALTALAPRLTGDLLTEGFSMACTMTSEWHRSRALIALAPQLTNNLLAEGLTEVRAMLDERYRAEVLVALAPYLTGELLKEGLIAAREIESELNRFWVLETLAPQLPDDLLAEVLAAATMIANEWKRSGVLASLAPHLRGDLLVKGLAAARMLEKEQARVLKALLPHLTGDLLTEGLALARAITNDDSRAWLLASLLPHLSGADQDQVLAEGVLATRAIKQEETRLVTLTSLLPQLTDATREQILTEELATARMSKDDRYREHTLVYLARYLTGNLLMEGLRLMREIVNKGSQAKALLTLVPYLTDDLLQEGLALAYATGEEWSMAYTLALLAPRLTGDLLLEGLTATYAIGDEELRAIVLSALVSSPHMSAALLEEIHRALLDCFWTLQTRKRTELLDFLAHNDLLFLRTLRMTQKGYEQIAQSVIAICTQWEWL